MELMIACDYSLPVFEQGPGRGSAQHSGAVNQREEELAGEALTRFLHLDIAWRLHNSFWEGRVV